MRIFRYWNNIDHKAHGAVIAVGNFDGVHLGHGKVISKAAEIAREEGAALGVMTFEPHPRELLSKSNEPFRLTPFRAKTEAIASLGVDIIYVLKFNQDLANLEAQDFIKNVLVEGLRAKHIVVGYDFAFGSGRKGEINLLKEKSSTGEFKVTSVEKAEDENGPFSASAARQYIKLGDVKSAQSILGRPWQVLGRIRYGDQIGRSLGFPTANLSVKNILKPKSGIYAVWAGIGIKESDQNIKIDWQPGAAYVGRRPTFDKSEELLEVHLLDFNYQIYGQLLRVAFISWIRGDEKYENSEDLKKQMYLDCQHARAILAESSPPSNTLHDLISIDNTPTRVDQ